VGGDVAVKRGKGGGGGGEICNLGKWVGKKFIHLDKASVLPGGGEKRGGGGRKANERMKAGEFPGTYGIHLGKGSSESTVPRLDWGGVCKPRRDGGNQEAVQGGETGERSGGD